LVIFVTFVLSTLWYCLIGDGQVTKKQKKHFYCMYYSYTRQWTRIMHIIMRQWRI